MELLDLDIFTESNREVKIRKLTFVIPAPEDIPMGLVLEQIRIEMDEQDMDARMAKLKAVMLKIFRLRKQPAEAPDDLFDGLGLEKFRRLMIFVFQGASSKKEGAEPKPVPTA